MTWETELWDDIEYVARFNPHRSGADNGCHWVDFEVFDVVGFPCEGGRLKEHTCWGKGKPCSFKDEVPCSDLDNAEFTAKGHITFDGCSKWEFNNSVHICGLRCAKHFREMIDRVFMKVKVYVNHPCFE